MNHHTVPNMAISTATTILDGFRTGDLDEYDLAGIFEHPKGWLAESESHAARTVRGEES